MIGNKIYQIICRRNSSMGIETDIGKPHATFDGAYKRIDELKKYWADNGYEVMPMVTGGFDVYMPKGPWTRTYRVLTKTIVE